MADVLLAHTNFARLDPKQVEAGRPWMPLGTLYAASELRRRGHSVSLFDATFASGPAEFTALLAKRRPDCIALVEDSFNWLSKMCLEQMRNAALEMTREARSRGIPLLAHGSDVADHPADYLQAGASVVALGEAEQTVAEWVEGLSVEGSATSQPTGIAGLGWLGAEGKVARSRPRALLKELDTLAWPARDLIDVGRYRDAWVRRHGRFTTNLVTTRGCPFLCNWCAKPVYGQTYHSRSPEDVAREMASLKRDFGVESLWFADDILGMKVPWLARLAESIEAEGARLPFQCQTRADLMAEGGAAWLARAGCEEAWLGVESGSQAVLDAMDKGITLEQVATARANLESLGVRVAFFLQFGYPGEDWAEIRMTRAMLRNLVPDDIGISVAYPQPGTRFHDSVKGRVGEKQRWNTSGDLDPLFPGVFDRDFYRRLHGLVHAELRLARAGRSVRRLLAEPTGGSARDIRQIGQGLRALPSWLGRRIEVELARRVERTDTPAEAPARRLVRRLARRPSTAQ